MKKLENFPFEFRINTQYRLVKRTDPKLVCHTSEEIRGFQIFCVDIIISIENKVFHKSLIFCYFY